MSYSEKDLRRQFGKTDVEGAAMALYHEFHQTDPDNTYDPWPAYEDIPGDTVVNGFREMATIAADIRDEAGIGEVYHMKEPPPQRDWRYYRVCNNCLTVEEWAGEDEDED